MSVINPQSQADKRDWSSQSLPALESRDKGLLYMLILRGREQDILDGLMEERARVLREHLQDSKTAQEPSRLRVPDPQVFAANLPEETLKKAHENRRPVVRAVISGAREDVDPRVRNWIVKVLQRAIQEPPKISPTTDCDGMQ